MTDLSLCEFFYCQINVVIAFIELKFTINVALLVASM